MEIFREENWKKWENGDFIFSDLATLDREKDKMLLTWMAINGRKSIQNDELSELFLDSSQGWKLV